MTTTEVAQRLEAWAVETNPGLNSYSEPPTDLGAALPLVIAEVQRDRQAAGERTFVKGQYEQVKVRLRSFQLRLLTSPEPAWSASQALYGYVDALVDAMRRDDTLGGRFDGVLDEWDASYDPPEVEYEDGTRARHATFDLTVAERLEA